MQIVAEKEYMEHEILRQKVAEGSVCIPANINHKSLSPEGIGSGLKTKINVNLGISGDCKNYDMEMSKVKNGYRLRLRSYYGSDQLRINQYIP